MYVRTYTHTRIYEYQKEGGAGRVDNSWVLLTGVLRRTSVRRASYVAQVHAFCRALSCRNKHNEQVLGSQTCLFFFLFFFFGGRTTPGHLDGGRLPAAFFVSGIWNSLVCVTASWPCLTDSSLNLFSKFLHRILFESLNFFFETHKYLPAARPSLVDACDVLSLWLLFP